MLIRTSVPCALPLCPDHGSESHLLTLHEGDMFGERALIKKEARQANVIASGPVECYYLESQDFYAMLGELAHSVCDRVATVAGCAGWYSVCG